VNQVSGAVFIRKGKGNKSRSVFIGRDARRALRRYLQARTTGPLWTIQAGGRLSYAGLCSLLRNRAAKAGVTVPSPHDFRRAFAVNSLRAGMDLETLRRLMGHADYTVLRRYLALVDEDLAAAHARTSPADGLRNLNERR
jgi:site-specific recombinase XerD